MTDLYETGLLLDFYGKMLTDSQYECLDMYCNDDMSLAEIADVLGISRQGVHDTIKRGKAALEEYENKLGILSKFLETKSGIVSVIDKLNDDLKKHNNVPKDEIATVLEELKKIEAKL